MDRQDRKPRRTRPGRLAHYLGAMFPLPLMVPFCAATVLGVYFGLQALGAPGPLHLGWHAAFGGVSFFLFHLLIRVQDEFKDAEHDRRMAEAGDPWYTDRPLVTGMVTTGDLQALRWTAIATILALNAPMGFPFPVVGCLAGFAVLWLSLRYFFFPAAADNRLWQLLFGGFIFLVLVGYLVTIYLRDFGARSLTGWTLPLVLGQVTPLLGIEMARKFRAASQETAAQTYSKIFGERIASLLPGAFALVSIFILVPLARAADLGWGYPAAVLATGLLVIGAGVRFCLRPSPERARLLPFSAIFLVTTIVGLPIALWARYGLAS